MRALVLSVCLLLAGATSATFQSSVEERNAPPPYEDPDAYKVYSAILPELSVWQESKTVLIQVETMEGVEYCGEPDEKAQVIVGSAIADYTRVNQKEWSLQNHFDIGKPYELIHSPAVPLYSARNTPAWPYPDSQGFVAFSAVGFNPHKTIAIVAVTEGYARGGSAGNFRELEKSGGTWQQLKLKQGKYKYGCAWAS